MDIFESLEELNVSEECFKDIVSMTEEMINEYIKRGRFQKILNTTMARMRNTDNAPEGPEKEANREKERRNVELTNNYVEKHGSPLQKAFRRGYSKNAAEKKALLHAGYALKDDPIESGRSNIVKY